MTDDITVSRDYFLTLLRRAELADQEHAKTTVRIDITEYEALVITLVWIHFWRLTEWKRNAAHEYKILVNALIAAGTPLESIHILTRPSGIPTPPEDTTSALDDRCELKAGHNPIRRRQRAGSIESIASCSSLACEPRKLSRIQSPPLPTPSPSNDASAPINDTPQPGENQESAELTDSHEDRSIIFKGLPKSATLADIVKIIHGGTILNLFLRPQQGTAHVAFVEPEAAEMFLIHANRTELKIKGKNIIASWDQRQYYLTGGLAKRIRYDGASRNLVVRFPKPEVTAKVIRDDLEHICSLEVVEIHFRNGHAWISLNGIKNAVTARACMSSRQRYRGSRVEFWADECAGPFPSRTKTQPQQSSQLQKKTSAIFSNRFLTLHDENAESDSDCAMNL